MHKKHQFNAYVEEYISQRTPFYGFKSILRANLLSM